MLIDTHCHLDLPQFDEDREVGATGPPVGTGPLSPSPLLDRAAAAGVTILVTIGIDLDHSRSAIALAERHPQVYATVGIHPNETADFGPETLASLRSLAAHPKVVAIGEIGLDYYWQRVPAEIQKQALRSQLDLAAELGLPVVIHDRDAHEDVRAELRAWVHDRLPGSPLARRPFAGVLHSFSGDLAMAEEANGWGFVLGLAGPVTFKNARDLHALARQLRPDRLLLETDAPYLTPHPYRGRRNEPAYVRLVAEKLAELWDMPFHQVATLTTNTACAFYGLERLAPAGDAA